MSNSAQVTGFMTVSNSKNFDQDVKEKIVSASEGKIRVIRKVLIDPETNEEVVITGKLRISENSGSLTSRVAFKLNNIQSLIVNEKPKKEKKKVDVEKLASELGMEDVIA